MRKSFIRVSKEELNITQDTLDDKFLDLIHKKLAISELNDFRLSMIRKVNALPDFRQNLIITSTPPRYVVAVHRFS